MKIITVKYDGTFERLYSVYKKSIELNIPNAEHVNINLPMPENNMGRPCFCHHNHTKLEAWAEYMSGADDNIIFSDADMLALRDPVEIWDNDFDICYTARTHTNAGRSIPLNGGIIFARPTDNAREFFRLWAQTDKTMYENKEFHDRYYRKYAGMNQASLGYLIENPDLYSARVASVFTLKYNAVDCDWRYVNDETCFVHIKSLLRQKILTKQNPSGQYKEAMIRWYRIKKCR